MGNACRGSQDANSPVKENPVPRVTKTLASDPLLANEGVVIRLPPEIPIISWQDSELQPERRETLTEDINASSGATTDLPSALSYSSKSFELRLPLIVKECFTQMSPISEPSLATVIKLVEQQNNIINEQQSIIMEIRQKKDPNSHDINVKLLRVESLVSQIQHHHSQILGRLQHSPKIGTIIEQRHSNESISQQLPLPTVVNPLISPLMRIDNEDTTTAFRSFNTRPPIAKRNPIMKFPHNNLTDCDDINNCDVKDKPIICADKEEIDSHKNQKKLSGLEQALILAMKITDVDPDKDIQQEVTNVHQQVEVITNETIIENDKPEKEITAVTALQDCITTATSPSNANDGNGPIYIDLSDSDGDDDDSMQVPTVKAESAITPIIPTPLISKENLREIQQLKLILQMQQQQQPHENFYGDDDDESDTDTMKQSDPQLDMDEQEQAVPINKESDPSIKYKVRIDMNPTYHEAEESLSN